MLISYPNDLDSFRQSVKIVVDDKDQHNDTHNTKKLRVKNIETQQSIILVGECFAGTVDFELKEILQAWAAARMLTHRGYIMPTGRLEEGEGYEGGNERPFIASACNTVHNLFVTVEEMDENNNLIDQCTFSLINSHQPFRDVDYRPIRTYRSKLRLYDDLPALVTVLQPADRSLEFTLGKDILYDDEDNNCPLPQLNDINLHHLRRAVEHFEPYNSESFRLTIENAQFGKQNITIEHYATPKNPLFIRWINDLGGWEYQLFSPKHDVFEQVSNTKLFRPEYNDAGNYRDPEILSRQLTKTIRGGVAQVDAAELHILKSMFYSPVVEIYLKPGLTDHILFCGNGTNGEFTDGTVQTRGWKPIILKDYNLQTYRGKSPRYDFEIEAEIFSIIL